MKEIVILICISIILFIILCIFDNTVERFVDAPPTIDPMMILLRSILTSNGAKPLNSSISDSRLRMFAEDAVDSGNDKKFLENIGASESSWFNARSANESGLILFLRLVLNPPSDMPLMAALKEYFYWFIIPTITLSQLETAFKKTVIPTLTTDTAKVFIKENIKTEYQDKNQIEQWMPNVLATFKKAYDAEQEVKTGAAKLATYEPADTVDPLMVLLRGFFVGNKIRLGPRITDSKLRFFAEKFLKDNDIPLFMRNVGIVEDVKEDGSTKIPIPDYKIEKPIKFVLDPVITKSNDPIIDAYIKNYLSHITPMPIPSQVRPLFEKATRPTVNYSGVMKLLRTFGRANENTKNYALDSGMDELINYKAADDAQRAIAAKKYYADALAAKETELSSQRTTSAAALEAAKETLADAKKDAADTERAAKASADKVIALEKAAAEAKTAAEAKAIADAKIIAERDAAQKDLAAKEAAIVKVAAERDAAQKEIAAKEATIEKVSAEKDATKKELDEAKAVLAEAKKDVADTTRAAKTASDKVSKFEKAAAEAKTAAESKAIADAKNIAERDAALKLIEAQEAASKLANAKKEANRLAEMEKEAKKASAEKTAEKPSAPAAPVASISRVIAGVRNGSSDMMEATTASRAENSSMMTQRMALRAPASMITESDDTMEETDILEMDIEPDMEELDVLETDIYPNAIQPRAISRSAMQQNGIPLVEMPKPMRRTMKPSRSSCSSNCQEDCSDNCSDDCN